MPLSEPIQRWRQRGRIANVRGLDVFVLDEGKGSTVLLLHGFPTSSYDWSAILGPLSERHRVVALDFPGYGLSAKPRIYSYSLVEQADVALAVCAQLDVHRAHVFAHDMGTSVTTELLARRESGTLPLAVASIALMNGSVHLEMARLTPSQKVLRRPLLGRIFTRLASRTTFKLQFRRLFSRPDALPDGELDRLWELLIYDEGHLRLPQSIRYIEERIQLADRWLPPLTRLDVPALVLWGRRDPVARFVIAERLAREIPGAKLVALEDTGHYPQLENPSRVAHEYLSFLDAVEQPPPS